VCSGNLCLLSLLRHAAGTSILGANYWSIVYRLVAVPDKHTCRHVVATYRSSSCFGKEGYNKTASPSFSLDTEYVSSSSIVLSHGAPTLMLTHCSFTQPHFVILWQWPAVMRVSDMSRIRLPYWRNHRNSFPQWCLGTWSNDDTTIDTNGWQQRV
jgi:hypothetical protein